MKILLTISDISITGGAERVVANLANAFQSRGHSIEVLSVYRANEMLPYTIESKVNFIYDIGENALKARYFRHFLGKFYFKNLFKIALSLRIRRAYRDFDMIIVSDWTFSPFFQGILGHFFAPRYVKIDHLNFSRYNKRNNLFDTLVVLSHKERDIWARYHRNVVVIPNFLPQIPAESSDLSQKVVLSVGRLTHQKGFLRLLDIWARVRYLSDSSLGRFRGSLSASHCGARQSAPHSPQTAQPTKSPQDTRIADSASQTKCESNTANTRIVLKTTDIAEFSADSVKLIRNTRIAQSSQADSMGSLTSHNPENLLTILECQKPNTDFPTIAESNPSLRGSVADEAIQEKTVDCHADKSARNDKITRHTERSEVSIDSPSLAEGARGWVESQTADSKFANIKGFSNPFFSTLTLIPAFLKRFYFFFFLLRNLTGRKKGYSPLPAPPSPEKAAAFSANGGRAALSRTLPVVYLEKGEKGISFFAISSNGRIANAQALEASSGWGIAKGEGATSQFKPLPLSQKEKSQNLETRKATIIDSVKQILNKIFFRKVDCHEVTPLTMTKKLDTSGIRPQYDGVDSESNKIDCHAHASRFTRNDTHPLTPSAREGERVASSANEIECVENPNAKESQAQQAKDEFANADSIESAIANANSSIFDEKSGLCSHERGNKTKSSIDEASGKLPDFSQKDEFAKAQLAEWKLIIVGSGEQQPLIESKINELNLQDSVILKPFTKAIEKEYLSASIYAMSSYFEGFGMVLAEASSFGLPCVAFDVPAGPSDIIADSKSGFLIPDNDIEAYARRLITLMSDEKLRQKMGENAKKLVSEKFSKDGIMPLWEGPISEK